MSSEICLVRLTEELTLLMLDEESGYLEMVPGWDFACVMAGAVIADLTLEGRIDTDLETLHLINSTPTGDELLDPTLQEIAEAEDAQSTQYWIERSAGRSEDIVTVTLERLVEKGILDYQSGGFWTLARSVSRSGKYPGAAGKGGMDRREAKTRILDVVWNDDIPDPRDAILVSLMHTCEGLKLFLPEEDYLDRLQRIETLCKVDLVGRTVFATVRNSIFRPKTRQVLPTKPIPKLPIAAILRQSDFLRGNIPKAMCQIYKRHGSVVELPVRMGGQRAVVLMGAQANQWVNKKGRFFLRSKDYIKDLEGVFGASRTLPGMDGAEHHKMRKAVRGAYSRATLTQRLPELIGLCREGISQWQEGHVFRAAETFRNYISNQVSHLLIGVNCREYAHDLIEYEHRALVTHTMRALPKFMLSTPKMKRARRHVATLQDAIHASHTPTQRAGKPLDLSDAILELHRSDPQFLPETDLAFPFVASMVASIYLGSSLGFAVYAMVRNPELHEAISREADALFSNGREPPAEDFRPENMDVTHRLFLESERIYPVIPWQLRTVMNRCVVDGFEIPPQTRLLICHTVPHYLDDLFPEPLKFDIDRYLPGREEHMAPGAYAPYGLGTHTCLGHRWLELQIAVNLLLIAHHVKLEMLPANYRMGINPFPTAAPNRKLRFRVAEVRNRV